MPSNYTPQFNGEYLFGFIVTMKTAPNPVGYQIWELPGQNGVFIMKLGTRGKTTEIKGVHISDSREGLETLQQAVIDHHQAGTISPMRDTRGKIHPMCLIIGFTPEGEIINTGRYIIQAFSAQVFHLI